VGLAERIGVVARTTGLLLATTLVAGAAFAQGGGSTPASAADQVDVSVKQRSTLSPQDMLKQSKDYFKAMNDVVKRIATLQEQSKRQKDIIKLNCVTDKLVQGKINVTIAEQSLAALQENIARADEGGRAHEFTRLTIVNQKVLVLGAEAENCIGEDLSFVGATRIDVEVDPNIPQTDGTLPPFTTIEDTRPPPASDLTGPT
jgi:hypothetical protein